MMVMQMPNDVTPEGIVIASAYITDDEWAILVLRPEAPFYLLAWYDAESMVDGQDFWNIVHATNAYLEMTGCV